MSSNPVLSIVSIRYQNKNVYTRFSGEKIQFYQVPSYLNIRSTELSTSGDTVANI